MDKKLLLWDIDGTLMSCYMDGTLALNETFRRRTGHENACGEVIVGTAMDSALVDRIMMRFSIPPEEKPQIITEFAGILREIVANNQTKRVLPGVREILDRLKSRKDVCMGLITSNFRIGAEIKLDSVGLLDYFTFGGFGDTPGEKWDAARNAIEKAEKIIGGSFCRENIYVIGDTKYDILCGKKNGVKTVAVATGWADIETLKAEKPDYLLESLEDTEGFLEIVLGLAPEGENEV